LTKYGPKALQYDVSEGFAPLRAVLASHLRSKGLGVEADQILVTSGSQAMLDLIGKVMISKGDPIAVEAPTYLGAIQAFNAYEPHYLALETDDKGVKPGALEKVLQTRPVKLVYLVPTFQNPTGKTLSEKRRHLIADLLKKYDTLAVEDDPYSALRYRGNDLPPLKALAPEHVIYVSSLSKVFAPGLRVGFGIAPDSIRRWLVVAKQGMDLHTSTLNQALEAEYLAQGFLESHLPAMLKNTKRGRNPC
jgi:2-aminoadipate transaminase